MNNFEVPDEYKWILPGAECVFKQDKSTVTSTPFFKDGDWWCFLEFFGWKVECSKLAKVEVVEEPITLTLSKSDVSAFVSFLMYLKYKTSFETSFFLPADNIVNKIKEKINE